MSSLSLHHARHKALVAVMCVSVFFILITVLISFIIIRERLTDITENNLSAVFANSSHGREYVKLAAEIDIFSFSFLGKEKFIVSEAARLNKVIDDIIKTKNTDQIRTAYQTLGGKFNAFSQECNLVNAAFLEREKTFTKLESMIRNLEEYLGGLLLEKTLNSEDTKFIEQLLVLCVGYQESLLKIDRAFSKIKQEYNGLGNKVGYIQVLNLVDDLVLRLQTVTVSVPYIAGQCSEIINFIKDYRQTVSEYSKGLESLKLSKIELDDAGKTLLSQMRIMDETMHESAIASNQKIIKIILFTGAIILVVTICVLLGFFGIVVRLFKAMNLEIENRINAEKSLDRLNLELEERVDQRTRELSKANIHLEKNMSELKQAEKAIQDSEVFLNAIIENIPNMIFVKDAQTLRFVRLNKAGEELIGLSSTELLGKNDKDFFPPDQAEFFMNNDRKVLEIGRLFDIPEEPIKSRSHGERILHTKKIPIKDGNGKFQYLLGISEDITERKVIENQINASLKEKETLLKEIHHRVKNNMQVISSLLSLQSGSVTDQKILDALMEAEARVRSMAFVHEILYQSKDISKIKFQDYLEAVTDHLIHLYESPENPVVIEIHAHGVQMAMEQAVPCGLIITELVINSLKYAVQKDTQLKIKITSKYEPDTHCLMEITDNGPGLPAEFDFKSVSTLGLKLVTGLITDQLEGTFHVKNAKGTKWLIHWPME